VFWSVGSRRERDPAVVVSTDALNERATPGHDLKTGQTTLELLD
jgi:hypothetical protein